MWHGYDRHTHIHLLFVINRKSWMGFEKNNCQEAQKAHESQTNMNIKSNKTQHNFFLATTVHHILPRLQSPGDFDSTDTIKKLPSMYCAFHTNVNPNNLVWRTWYLENSWRVLFFFFFFLGFWVFGKLPYPCCRLQRPETWWAPACIWEADCSICLLMKLSVEASCFQLSFHLLQGCCGPGLLLLLLH